MTRQIEAAVFIDLESAAGGNLGPRRFDARRLIDLVEEDFDAKIRIANAYADFRYHAKYIEKLHLTGVEAVQVTGYEAGKQSVDMRICCDALITAYEQPNITRFIILANDTDYVPLVRVLRKMGKSVFLLCKKDREYIEAAYATFCDRIVDYANLPTYRPIDDEPADSGADAGGTPSIVPSRASSAGRRRKQTAAGSAELRKRPGTEASLSSVAPASVTLQQAQTSLLEAIEENGGSLFGSQILPLLRRKLGQIFDFSDVGYASAREFALSFPQSEVSVEVEGLADFQISLAPPANDTDLLEDRLQWIIKNARLSSDYHFTRDMDRRGRLLTLCYDTIRQLGEFSRIDLVESLCGAEAGITRTEANDYFSVLTQCGCFDKVGNGSPSRFTLKADVENLASLTSRYECSLVYKSLSFLQRVGRLDDWTIDLQSRLFGRESGDKDDELVYLRAREQLEQRLGRETPPAP